MKFSCEIEDLHLTIEAIKEKFEPTVMDIKEHDKNHFIVDEGMDFYALYFTSKKADIELKHYLPAQLLSNDSEEQQSDIEYILDEDGIVDMIFEKWEILEAKAGPSWKDNT
jgi:2-hydroxy-3-keto-5-methylthiopentenyl-1-phosphate phosphatase